VIEGKATVKPSYRSLRGLYLGADFVRQAELQAGHKYQMVIDGLDDLDIEGTLDAGAFIGGLSPLYNSFSLRDGDQVGLRWDGTLLHLTPPQSRGAADGGPAPSSDRDVFDRKGLKHLHIEAFAPGNLTTWSPQTEPDIYMAFGVLSEYTDFRYCCGASKALLAKLDYTADTKPDAILIDRTSSAYLVAEFKMYSSEFAANHKAEDVDVLVCWIDDASDKSQLPARVLSLRSLLESAVREGTIDL
jgi:hypothetical protein